MEKEFENLSPHESLDLIQSMINQAQGNLLKNSFYFILWGWAIALANLGIYCLLKFSDFPYPHLIWLIAVPAWVITMIYGSRQGSTVGKKTHLDKVNMWMWLSYGFGIIPFIIFMDKIGYNVNPVIITLTSIPTFLTGIMLRFRPLILGGLSFYIFGIICFLVSPMNQYLVAALAVACGYLIPGYILKTTRENV